MDIWKWFGDHINGEADKLAVVAVPGSQSGYRKPRKLEANRTYFQLIVSDMWLTNDEIVFHTVHPSVQSLVRLRSGDRQVTLPKVVGPDSFDVQYKDRKGVATKNQFMTQPIAFRGGEVEVQVALLRMPGDDQLKSFLNVLSSVSSLVVLPPLETALGVAAKVEDGVGELLGLGNAKLIAGLQDTFTGKDGPRQLDAGYIAVIQSDGQPIQPEDLWVNRTGELRTGKRGSQPFTKYDYVLLHFAVSSRRDDWLDFKAIGGAYQRARALWKTGNRKEANRQIDAAITAVLTSDEFVQAQQDSIVKAIEHIRLSTKAPANRRDRVEGTPPLKQPASLPSKQSLRQVESRIFHDIQG